MTLAQFIALHPGLNHAQAQAEWAQTWGNPQWAKQHAQAPQPTLSQGRGASINYPVGSYGGPQAVGTGGGDGSDPNAGTTADTSSAAAATPAAVPLAPLPAPPQLASIQAQISGLPDIYNPQRANAAYNTQASLEGQGYSDPGTARVSQQGAVDPQGNPLGRDVRYFVYKGADGYLYRQAYSSLQSKGAASGMLFGTGIGDQWNHTKQNYDYQRQQQINASDQTQQSTIGQEMQDAGNLQTSWNTALGDWQTANSDRAQGLAA